jgi:predicted kinase
LALGHEFFGPLEPVVWSVVETQVRALLTRGWPFLLIDATNITKWERARWKRLGDEFGVSRTVAHVFSTKPSECVERARDNSRVHMVPVIERMTKKQQAILPEEGIEVVRIV